MKCAAIISLALVSGACSAADKPKLDPQARPVRIISLDYCADQYVLKLIDRERILAVSPDAGKSFSYMRKVAKGIPTVRSTAEDVLVLQPDLIVRSYGGGPNAAAFFESAGVPVITVGRAGDVDGIKALTLDMAQKLGEPQRGQAIVDDMTARLSAIQNGLRDDNRKALYLTPTGVTTGEGSLVHEMLLAAGLQNFEAKPGWRSVSLERLVYEQPDMIASAFFGEPVNHKDAWGSMAHPIAREKLDGLPTTPLEGAWTSCGAWFLMDAIEALAVAASDS